MRGTTNNGGIILYYKEIMWSVRNQSSINNVMKERKNDDKTKNKKK